MKLTLKCECPHGNAGDVVDIADMGEAHAMMADGLAVRQAVPDEDAPKKTKKSPKKK